MEREEPADGWREDEDDSHHHPVWACHGFGGLCALLDGCPNRGKVAARGFFPQSVLLDADVDSV